MRSGTTRSCRARPSHAAPRHPLPRPRPRSGTGRVPSALCRPGAPRSAPALLLLLLLPGAAALPPGCSEGRSEGSCVPSSPAPGCCCRFGASSPAHHGQAERSVPCFVALGALFHWLPSLHYLHGVHNPSATLVFLCLFFFFCTKVFLFTRRNSALPTPPFIQNSSTTQSALLPRLTRRWESQKKRSRGQSQIGITQ